MERKKILWVRLDAIGDNLLAASMLPHIYEKFGHAAITVVCQKHIAELYRASPYVERVVGVDKMAMFLDTKYRNEILLELRSREFDLALDSTCSWEQLADFLVVGSLAKEKVAFRNSAAVAKNVKGKRDGIFTTLLEFSSIYEPELEKYREFLAGIGINAPALNSTVWIPEEDDAFAADFFGKNKLRPEKTMALFAFGRSHLRTYPFYGNALEEVCAENDFSILAFGDAPAYGFNQNCLNEINARSINLSGKTTLLQTAALMKRCRIAVGAETGLAHMACAVDIPNVVVLGGGHYGRFMPYARKTSVVALPLDCYWCDWTCKYEYSHCVVNIAPEVVETAVRETLSTESARPRLFLHPASRWTKSSAEPAWQMPDKFTTSDNVDIISVEFNRKYPAGRISRRDLESKFAMHNDAEMPKSVAEALESAGGLRRAGESAKALEILEDAIQKNPGFPPLLNMKGELYVEEGRLEEARAIFFGIITLIPFHTDAMNNIAVLDILQKRYDSAIGVLKRLLEVEPDNKVALSNLRFIEKELNLRNELLNAEQLIINEDLDSARQVLDSILKEYPDNEDALSDLAVVEARDGRSGEALRLLQRVLAGNPDNEFAAKLLEKVLLGQ